MILPETVLVRGKKSIECDKIVKVNDDFNCIILFNDVGVRVATLIFLLSPLPSVSSTWQEYQTEIPPPFAHVRCCDLGA